MRTRLKWTLTAMTVLLGLACGPWWVEYAFSQRVRISTLVGYLAVYDPVSPPWVWTDTGILYSDWASYTASWGAVQKPWLWRYGGGLLYVSLWPWLLLCAGVTAYLWLDRPAKPTGNCPTCDYDLRGSVSDVCSECGHEIVQ